MHIETERMILRDFYPDDAADLHGIFGDDETMENVEPAYDPEKTIRFLNEFCIDRHGAFTAYHKLSSKVIGYVLFKSPEPQVYEIGWIFHKQYWRKGYAYEICHALIEYSFTALNEHKIFAEATDPVKSAGLMKSLE